MVAEGRLLVDVGTLVALVDSREVGGRYFGGREGREGREEREGEGAARSGRGSGRAKDERGGEATSSFEGASIREFDALAAVRPVAKVDENSVEELRLRGFSATKFS